MNCTGLNGEGGKKGGVENIKSEGGGDLRGGYRALRITTLLISVSLPGSNRILHSCKAPTESVSGRGDKKTDLPSSSNQTDKNG